ncbi:MAG: 37S ribosomal protein S22 [Bogoriella megaspora]|nr:MAG: 37S ribosomal protein S22 [Bogoriella megaspora]
MLAILPPTQACLRCKLRALIAASRFTRLRTHTRSFNIAYRSFQPKNISNSKRVEGAQDQENSKQNVLGQRHERHEPSIEEDGGQDTQVEHLKAEDWRDEVADRNLKAVEKPAKDSDELLIEEHTKEEEPRGLTESELSELSDAQDDSIRPPLTTEEAVRVIRQQFGDTLPDGILDDAQYKIYERLYGTPIKSRDVQQDLDIEVDVEDISGTNTLLRDGENGLEEVENDPGGFADLPKKSEPILYDEVVHPRKSRERISGLSQDKQGIEARIRSLHSQREDGQQSGISITPEDEQLLQNVNQEIFTLQESLKKLDRTLQEQTLDAGLEEFSDAWIDDVNEERGLALDEQPIQLAFGDQENVDDELYGEEARAHPMTFAGRFGTSPSSVVLPRSSLIDPISALLANAKPVHLREAAHRVFGGEGLPFSPLRPQIAKTLPQTEIPINASQDKMSDTDADLYMAAVMPSVYASIMSILIETRKRLGSQWLEGLIRKEGGPRILDAGSGGVGAIAVREILQAEWKRLKELESTDRSIEPLPPYPPMGKAVVLTGSHTLRHRSSTLLENTTFVPRLPDYIHADSSTTNTRKPFDIVIAPHSLWQLQDDFRRKLHVQNLWSLTSDSPGILIILEKGIPRGFELVAGARKLLLEKHISSPGSTSWHPDLSSPIATSSTGTIPKELGMIVAPCTNHSTCPLYKASGLSPGRKDYCSFEQRFIRPPYLQSLLNAKGRNFSDVPFSYIAVLRGADPRQTSSPPIIQNEAATEAAFKGYSDAIPSSPPLSSTAQSSQSSTPETDKTVSPLTLPRLIVPPLKRKGHILLDVCTPSGTFERWTVPKSFGKQAFRDARKSQWGDLWALGGKTRLGRNVKVGLGEEDGDGGGRKGKGKGGGKISGGKGKDGGLGRRWERKGRKGGDRRGREEGLEEVVEGVF